MQEDDLLEDDLFDRQIYKVDPGQQPLRIDKFLMDRLWNVSRSKIQNGITSGAVKVNDVPVKSNYKVQPGDEIAVLVPHAASEVTKLTGENIPLDIIYEDEDLLVVNKMAGMVVHPGVGNHDGTLVNALIYHLENQVLPVLKGNPDDRPGLVHRIDKNTSGLLVIAKNEFTLSHLARQFYDHTSERTYLALVWGQPDPSSGTISSYIGRDPKDRTRHRVFDEGESGKLAVTHYHTVEPMYYVSLMECRLETGRTHQIRVHLSRMGHPLFGDDKYGGDQIMKGTVFQRYRQFVANCFSMMPFQALHAQTLGFEHPRTRKRLLFSAPPPLAFEQVVNKWRLYVHTRKEDLITDGN